MDSNHSQHLTNGQPTERLGREQSMQQYEDGQDQSTSGERQTASTKCPRSATKETITPKRASSFNEVRLLRNCRIKFDQATRRQMESVCEDKISKYKLEDVHCSVPSSIKSTFIMTFSPDAQRVASTHGDHRIYICDLNTGKLLDTLEGHPKTPWCLAWHPSNRDILASGCLAGEVRVWDLKTKACEFWTSENNTIITSIDFHPKERVLVIATANDLLFWDWNESEPFAKTTTAHDREKVKFVVFDSSGTKLITGISNLPRFAGYSDSLQNRIIDGYLSSQGNIDQSTTENMTQHSEITTSVPAGSTANVNLGENNANALSHRRNNSHTDATGVDVSLHTNINNVCDTNYQNTVTLNRVLQLYKQLESLEDSIRNTSFTPYTETRPVRSSMNANVSSSNSAQNNHLGEAQLNESEASQSTSPPINCALSQTRDSDNTLDRTARFSNTFEPYLVTFDESLEQLQLPPLIVDGQTINLATAIDRNPIEMSNTHHHAMQFDIINQVNPNFIRISKLMSSARLYRQVVQQILSSNSSGGHHQPNQILTAQSLAPRSFGSSSNLPIVLRNFPLGNSLEATSLIRGNRPNDPILAIQFRNSARNVPLVTICKIDLIAARAVCIMRSQQLVEQALSNMSQSFDQSEQRQTGSSATLAPKDRSASQNLSGQSDQARYGSSADNSVVGKSFYSILSQLHSSLTTINHAPLTTSNVYSHITSLRVITEKLLRMLSSMLHTVSGERRIVDLIHEIAYSLTRRRWTIPLGSTLDEIRLDVIHTLCIVDLTLHFARQIQLLQMQRVSIFTRIDESRRAVTSINQNIGSSTYNQVPSSSELPRCDISKDLPGPSNATPESLASKRKVSEDLEDDTKRRKTDTHRADEVVNMQTCSTNQVEDTSPPTDNSVHNSPASSTENAHAERLAIWNNPQNHVEQSLHRFLLATASGVSNSHILVRIHHRLNASPSIPTNEILEQNERPSMQQESRRRSLSQDNAQDHTDTLASSPMNRGHVNARVRAPALRLVPPSHSNGFDAWQRQPHLHVYQTRGTGQHLWFNQWTIPLPMNFSNYRLQCWNFSLRAVPDIKDSQTNVITQKCRIQNDSSIDISSDGSLLACLVPRDDVVTCWPSFDLKIFSLRKSDFGTCYHKLANGPNAMSVSLSPSGNHAVVGLAGHKYISNDQTDDDIIIAKVFKLANNESSKAVRDIKIKRVDSMLNLNAIKWMHRGIVYNVGPQHHQRYSAARMRNIVAP